ncbi:cell wall-binding repeat-containing protein [Herbiconiux liangxiaofengii]|uniref:cell wall-binding repeat-containing protein n=1 Tax=Herbiconiux liangxiaofengii TaxID=3342795 RepID=UPI0035B6CF0C
MTTAARHQRSRLAAGAVATFVAVSIVVLAPVAQGMAVGAEPRSSTAESVPQPAAAAWAPSEHDVEVVSPYYFHSTSGSLDGQPGLRADTQSVRLVLPPDAAQQGLETVDYRLQPAPPEVATSGTVPVDAATGSFTVPVAGTLTGASLTLTISARGPAPVGAPTPPPGAGVGVGEAFTASGAFTVYTGGPPSAESFTLSMRSFTGSEITRFATGQAALAAGPGDTVVVTVPSDLTTVSGLQAGVRPDPGVDGSGSGAAVSRTGDPAVAVVTVPLNYYDANAPGAAALTLGGSVGTQRVEYVVPVVMGNEPPATTVEIVPDGTDSPTGTVEIVASPVAAENYRVIIGPRSGASVSDKRYSVSAGGSLSIPFSGVAYPNRLTVYEVESTDGDTETSTMVGEYPPPGPAAAKTVLDAKRPERSMLYLDNRNQFGENRFTGETLSRVFDVTVDGTHTAYTLKGGATLRVPLTQVAGGSTIVVSVAGVTILDQVVPPSSIPTPAARISGSDRYEVAVNVSKQSHPDGADTVFLVSGENFSDALSAGPLATHSNAPLLLTTKTSLPGEVRDELARLAPTSIVVVGGPNSVANAVITDLERDYSVRRITGADRFALSRAVATEWAGDSPATVYVATGSTFPDALSAGAAAGAQDAPVLLVNGTSTGLDDPTEALLRSIAPESISIAGGPVSVSLAIESDLAFIAPTTRFGGADRFAASVAINASAFVRSSQAFLVTGSNYPDALSGGAWAGALEAPLYLSQKDCVPPAVLDQMRQQGVSRVTLIGGPASLSAEVANLKPC